MLNWSQPEISAHLFMIAEARALQSGRAFQPAATLDAIDREANGWPMNSEQRKAARGSTAHSDWSARGMYACFLLGVVAMAVAGIMMR